ncbi:MAG: dienelactone hydrolase family protein [Alphaproteobacteria bacterium]|nr:dienelactone hydrolase [Hyphomonas sp.]MBR9806875.1 dienelactone hydrolase family protein [Alphaproteobacteria bacterium]|tara:strand:- start:4370 stop:5257 length:888 start_codon:yes stop_codon:yes gene_type:complete
MTDTPKTDEIPQQIFDLYDDYCHGHLSRRGFFEGLGKYAVGGLTVSSLAACVLPDYSRMQTEPDEDDLYEEMLVYPSPDGAGEMEGYFVRPDTVNGELPGIVVIHENRGLNPHIKDVARRVAKAGYVAFAPDALSPLGGYPGNDDEGRALQAQRNRGEMIEDFMAGAAFLRDHAAVNGKVGCVGFCFGGAVANMMAVRLPWLSAAVPYYGGWPTAEQAGYVDVPLQIHLAGLDERVNAGWPAYKAALDANDVEYEAYIYPGVQHGFHNDTTPRYDEAAAKLAWSRTLDFFSRQLS